MKAYVDALYPNRSTSTVSNHGLLHNMAMHCTSFPSSPTRSHSPPCIHSCLVFLQVAVKSLANHLYLAVNTAHSVAMLSVSTWAPLGHSKDRFCCQTA